MKTSWLAWLGAAAAIVVGAPVKAQSTDGGVRLGFDFSFLGLDVLSVDDGSDSEDSLTFSSGFAFDDTFVNIGYGASEQLTLGMRLRSGSISTVFPDRIDDPTETLWDLTGLPYLEINLSDSGTFRPFLGPTLGIDLTVREARTDASDDPDFQSVDATFLFGALLGARIFVNDTFAIEPTLVATYGLGAFSDETAGGADIDGDTKVFALMLLFGGSAWLGGKPAQAPAAANPPAADVYEPAPYAPPPAAPAPAPAGAAPGAYEPPPYAPAAGEPPPPAQPAPNGAPAATTPAPEQVPAPPPAPR